MEEASPSIIPSHMYQMWRGVSDCTNRSRNRKGPEPRRTPARVYPSEDHSIGKQQQEAYRKIGSQKHRVVVEAAGFEPASANALSVRFYEHSSRFNFALPCGPGHRREASPLSFP